MELVSKLSFIEEIKERMKKCYNTLKRELKNNGSIATGNKKRAVNYVREMTSRTNQHYYEAKKLMMSMSKTDRISSQIERSVKSIKGYKERIDILCGYEHD